MSAVNRCPRCGNELSSGDAQGLCPQCLLLVGMESDTAMGGSQPGLGLSPGDMPTESHAGGAEAVKPTSRNDADLPEPGQQFGNYRLIRKLGKKQLTLDLVKPLTEISSGLADHDLLLSEDGRQMVYTYDKRAERTGITKLLNDLSGADVRFNDLNTTQSSLEDIFVDLVRETP